MNRSVSTGTENGEGKHLSEEGCVDLILGLLPDRDVDRIMEHLSSCTHCEQLLRERTQHWEQLNTRVPDAAAKVARRRIIVDVDERQISWWDSLRAMLAPRRARLGFGFGLAAAAASLILIFGVAQRGADSPALHWLPQFSGGDIRGPSAPSADFLAGVEAYERRELEQAVESLQSADDTGPTDLMRKIYLANALAWLGDYDSAVTALQAVPLDLLPDPWWGETHWTLFVSLRQVGESVRADSLLRALALVPGEVGERAQQLLAPDDR